MSQHIPLDENFTYISLLIDKSGSMINLDTNELAQTATKMLREQCEEGRTVMFDGGTFDDSFNIFASNKDVHDFTITPRMIKPNGMTALYPSIARMIKHTGENISKMTIRRPGKVIFILLSDGQQTVDKLTNAVFSDKKFEGSKGQMNLKECIEHQQKVYNWTFMFLGTNFDTITEGSKLGIEASHCMNYDYSSGGAHNALRSTSMGLHRVIHNQFDGFTVAEREASSSATKVQFAGDT